MLGMCGMSSVSGEGKGTLLIHQMGWGLRICKRVCQYVLERVGARYVKEGWVHSEVEVGVMAKLSVPENMRKFLYNVH